MAVGKRPVAEVLAEPESEQSPFVDHLRSLLLKLRRQEGLASAVRRVLDGDRGEIDFEIAQRLLRAGILAGMPGSYRLRYPIYERYFQTWLERT